MRTIALFFPRMTGYYTDVIAGIQAYAREHGGWSIRLATVEDTFAPMLRWRPDGIIGTFDRADMVRRLARYGGAVVTVSGRSPRPGLGAVYPDDQAAGQLAAEHLLDCGLRHFAFCGVGGRQFSGRRLAGFRDRIEKHGHSCSVFQYIDDLNPFRNWAHASSSKGGDLGGWLLKLSKPVGLFCANDRVALRVAQACEDLGIHVPEAVALVGVDNDPLLCEITTPALTSVELMPQRVGRRAASLVDEMLDGAAIPDSPVEIPPSHIVPRATTDTLAAHASPETLAALHIGGRGALKDWANLFERTRARCSAVRDLF